MSFSACAVTLCTSEKLSFCRALSKREPIRSILGYATVCLSLVCTHHQCGIQHVRQKVTAMFVFEMNDSMEFCEFAFNVKYCQL